MTGFRHWMRDQLAEESVGVLEGDDALFIEAGLRVLELDAMLDEPLDPETHGARQNGEGRDRNLSVALAAPSGTGPWKESQNRSRIALTISKVEMVSRGIVEIHGSLDEPHAEDAGIEVEILLGVAGDRRDVMNTA